MITGGDPQRDLARLAVPLRGSLEATGDLFEPYRLAGPAGLTVGPAAAYLREVAASGRAAATDTPTTKNIPHPPSQTALK